MVVSATNDFWFGLNPDQFAPQRKSKTRNAVARIAPQIPLGIGTTKNDAELAILAITAIPSAGIATTQAKN
jgi:hypothetical protein